MRTPVFQRLALVVAGAVTLTLGLLGQAPQPARGGPNEPVVQAHAAEVTRLTFIPQREYVMTSGADGVCTIWTYPDLQKFRDVMKADTGLISMTVSRDGKRVAAGDASGNLWMANLWGDEAKQPPVKQSVAQDAMLDLMPSGDDKRFFSLMLNPAEMNPSIRSWDSLTLTPDNYFQPKAVPALWAFSADVNTELIAAGADTGHVVRWKTPQSSPARYKGQGVKYTCTATSPDGRCCFFGDDSGGLWVITEERKEPVKMWQMTQPIASISLDDKGEFMAIGFGRPTRKEIYRRTSLKQPYQAPAAGSLPIVVMKTSTYLAGQGNGAPPEKQTFTVPGAAGGTLCAAFSKNGKHLVAGGADGTLRLWLITDGKSRISN